VEAVALADIAQLVAMEVLQLPVIRVPVVLVLAAEAEQVLAAPVVAAGLIYLEQDLLLQADLVILVVEAVHLL
jgi:hypothetical protein